MSEYFYEDYLGKESLVLYKYDDPTHDTILIEGYRLATRAIVDKITTFHSGEDSLIYPLLNLYTNIIEFSLKKTISLLNRHYEWGCDYLEKPIENSKITNHSLSFLYNEIKRILQRTSNPHFFELQLLENLIKEFDSVGIESISSRYHMTKNNTTHKMYHAQINIRVRKLHDDIEEIVNGFMLYWDNIGTQCPLE